MFQPIPTWKFHSTVLVFLAVDASILAGWALVDPMVLEQEEKGEQHRRGDTVVQEVLLKCSGDNLNVWMAVVFGYKCLVLVFGLFFAYESRNLKLRYVNDSKFVSMSVYNVVILSMLTGPVVTTLVPAENSANFAFIAATVLFCTSVSMGLIYVPKMMCVWRTPKIQEEAKKDETSDTTNPAGGDAKKSTIKNKKSSVSQRNTKLSKSEESRYNRLLVDNEDLKRQIDIVETKIMLARKRLNDHKASMRNRSSTTPGKSAVSSFLNPQLAPRTVSLFPMETLTKEAHHSLILTEAKIESASPASRLNEEEEEEESRRYGVVPVVRRCSAEKTTEEKEGLAETRSQHLKKISVAEEEETSSGYKSMKAVAGQQHSPHQKQQQLIYRTSPNNDVLL